MTKESNMKNLFLKTTLTLTLAFAATAAAAQEAGIRDAQGKVVRGPYETNRMFDNVFIGVAGGVNRYHGENDSYGSFGKRLAPVGSIRQWRWPRRQRCLATAGREKAAYVQGDKKKRQERERVPSRPL